MKVAVLQWVDSIDRGMGSIERISTTAKDCVDFLKKQLEGFYMKHFVFSDGGQVCIDYPEFRDNFQTYIEDDFDEVEKFIQNYLDNDELGTVYIKGFNSETDSIHWWKIQFRNIH